MSDNGNRGGRPIDHGIRPLEAAYAAGRIDPDSALGQELNAKRLALAEDAGGLERMTNRELALLDRCAFQVLVLDTIEAFVLTRGPLTKQGLMRNVLARQYIAHVNALRRNLEALGLRPERVEQLPTLEEYIRSHQDRQPLSADATLASKET